MTFEDFPSAELVSQITKEVQRIREAKETELWEARKRVILDNQRDGLALLAKKIKSAAENGESSIFFYRTDDPSFADPDLVSALHEFLEDRDFFVGHGNPGEVTITWNLFPF